MKVTYPMHSISAQFPVKPTAGIARQDRLDSTLPNVFFFFDVQDEDLVRQDAQGGDSGGDVLDSVQSAIFEA